ncbi:pyridoxal-phosphate dependent enzyme [Candidatus Dojkabacteria bacterium]|nr:pyridoxal-phosphate dependent enzyme [Candidatus Dojkabacteria bacterium]
MIPVKQLKLKSPIETTVHLKLENLNETGSHKDRGLKTQIQKHIDDGAGKFVISSSGNAAISASKFCMEHKLPLTIFVSPDTPKFKLDRIYNYPGLTIEFSKRPKHDAFQMAKNSKAVFLRASTDSYAVEGYQSIAIELSKQVPGCTDLFLPVSSGTTAVGVYQGFKILDSPNKIPRFHVVQTTRVNTISQEFDKDFDPTEDSIAQAIVDRIGHRKKEVIEIVRKTNGWGWVVSDSEIIQAKELMPTAIQASNEGAMSVAGLIKALRNDWEISVPVCIITGLGEN